MAVAPATIGVDMLVPIEAVRRQLIISVPSLAAERTCSEDRSDEISSTFISVL